MELQSVCIYTSISLYTGVLSSSTSKACSPKAPTQSSFHMSEHKTAAELTELTWWDKGNKRITLKQPIFSVTEFTDFFKKKKHLEYYSSLPCYSRSALTLHSLKSLPSLNSSAPFHTDEVHLLKQLLCLKLVINHY